MSKFSSSSSSPSSSDHDNDDTNHLTDQLDDDDDQEGYKDIINSSVSSNSSFFTCDVCVEPVPLTLKFNSDIIMKTKNEKNTIIGTSSDDPRPHQQQHSFCSDCITKYIEAKIEDCSTSGHEIKCPGLNCEMALDPLSCRSILPSSVFDRWLGMILCHKSASVALAKAQAGFSNSEVTMMMTMMIMMSEDDIIIRDINDILFFLEMVKRNKWTTCPVCDRYVEHTCPRCTFITCRCKTNFCYACRSKIRWYGSCVCKRTKDHLDEHAPRNVRIAIICFSGIMMGFMLSIAIYVCGVKPYLR